MCVQTSFAPWHAIAFAFLICGTSFAQQSSSFSQAELEFYRGYYLQHESHAPGEAVEAYRKAIELGPSKAIRSALEAEMAVLQEELATNNFAKVMPPDAIAYLEISNPADHIEKLAQVMGLSGARISSSEDKVTLRIEDELSVSSDFQISPALMREFKKIRGAAIAVTDLLENEPPFEGVAVIHPGDSDLISGILETGVQLVSATDRIRGFPTFNIENHAWIVKTNRLVIVATDKHQIEACLDRIANQDAKSLAQDANFEDARQAHQGAAVFAYLNPKMVMSKLENVIHDREFGIVRTVLDCDHMEHATAALMATDEGARARLGIKFSEDHNSFAYGLIRTVPLTGRAINHVPSGATGVIGVGLNPKLVRAAQATTSSSLSALDLGREVFANIEEVALFVLPSVSRENSEIPDVGLIVASSDLEKSETLWNQLLSLPSMLHMNEGPQAATISIQGIEGREYTFPGNQVPQLIVAKIDDEALVAGTRNAVEAAIKANATENTLANDKQANAFWRSKSEHYSKAAYLNVGQALRLAAALENGADADELRMVSEVIEQLIVTLVVNEAPAEFSVQADVTGLPQFDEIIKAVVKFQSGPVYAGNPKHPQPSVSDSLQRDISRNRADSVDPSVILERD